MYIVHKIRHPEVETINNWLTTYQKNLNRAKNLRDKEVKQIQSWTSGAIDESKLKL